MLRYDKLGGYERGAIIRIRTGEHGERSIVSIPPQYRFGRIDCSGGESLTKRRGRGWVGMWVGIMGE